MDVTITLTPEEQVAVEWITTQQPQRRGPGGRFGGETTQTPLTVEQYVDQQCHAVLAGVKVQYAKSREELALQKYYALPPEAQAVILEQIDTAANTPV
jgi:hypothetical protein